MRALGIDTSNYTTSAAVFDGSGGYNAGRLLEVRPGELGLRQSDALFQHIKHLPGRFAELRAEGWLTGLSAVGASARPRAVEGSYMPCFLVGEGQGRTLADALGVPFYPVSHQQGHIAAAAWSAGRLELLDRPMLAWHLSGGTTELLYVEPDGVNVRAQCVGGTSDISAGQLIDRTGVLLGLPFPAGKALDVLASESDLIRGFPVKLNDLTFSLSGMENKVKALLLRSAGYNHVDVKAAKGKIEVLRVPSYSPEAVAEFAMAMLLTVNRFTHKAYGRTREFNMNINGLMGTDLFHKVAGVIGTGKIGQAMIRIFQGFRMNILAYDPYPNKSLDVQYVGLEELLSKSDFISLHCPLTPETNHIINEDTIAKMKDGVYLVNTSRGGLIDTQALIDGLLAKKFGGVGLDVYEEEEGLFYEDCSDEIIQDDNLARLTTFPNVLITSHMGFFTVEAMQAIAHETLENAYALENGLPLKNKAE